MFKQQQQVVKKKKKKHHAASKSGRGSGSGIGSTLYTSATCWFTNGGAALLVFLVFCLIQYTFTLCRLLSVQICYLCQCNVTLPSLIQFIFITEDVRKANARQLPRHQNMFTAPSLRWWWSFVSAQTLFKGESSSITCMRMLFFCYFIITIFLNECIIGGRACSNRPSAFEHLLFRNAHNNWLVVEHWRPQVNEVYHGPLKPLALQSAATSRF